ncbi:MAG: SRPBCC domain-containing protein [Chloroflexota bacterium]|nr:SRPBCC domain-containing protein [Chloroflexota bacterium]
MVRPKVESARYEETVDAATDDVFDAWTKPAELMLWFGPGGFQTIEAQVDLRPGGRYQLVMRAPDGRLLTIVGVYREIDPGRRLVYSWTWAHAPAEEMTVTVEMHPVGTGATRVVVSHARIVDGERLRYESGWVEGIARLNALLAKSKRGG